MLQAHTHQWIGTFSGASGAGNGEDLGELRQAVKAIGGYVKAQSFPLSQAVVRLDGQYGNGAIVADLAGLAYLMRGKDYDLLDLPDVQARLAQPPDRASDPSAPQEPAGRSLTSLISRFRQLDHARGLSSPDVWRQMDQ